MEVLKQPIYILDNNGQLNDHHVPDNLSGDPIFVHYNQSGNHYNGFQLDDNKTGTEVLQQLQQQQSAHTNASMPPFNGR
jgi:hypothetical protein